MPTKRLPESANIDHLKRQAKELLRDFRSEHLSAFQRLREFHPKLASLSDDALSARTFALSDAQLSIAREYGYASWPRLKAVIAERRHEELVLIHNDRLPEGPFKQALDFMDAGDVERLSKHLAENPGLVDEEASFEGGNYFSSPTLLEFLPENPIRQGRLPENALDIAKTLLAAGADRNQETLDETLTLTASGRVCREAGVQLSLLRLLCQHGANPIAGMRSALAHDEFDAASILIECGAPLDLPTAAALDELVDVKRLLQNASRDHLQLALSLAANAGRSDVVRALLEAGADPNRYNPPGGHTHCTPLHNSVAADRFETVVALIEGGADTSIPDIHHSMTALGWAEHFKHSRIVEYLRSVD